MSWSGGDGKHQRVVLVGEVKTADLLYVANVDKY